MFNSSLQRLINLSQKTNDRLLVYDSHEDKTTVLMSLDTYEDMLLEDDFFYDDYDRHEMSGDQLLDKINRDIAIWQATKRQEEQYLKELQLEDEFADEKPFDPFYEHDYHPREWHSAGSVVENRYGNFVEENFNNNIFDASNNYKDKEYFTEDNDSEFDNADDEYSFDDIKTEDTSFDTNIENRQIEKKFSNQDVELSEDTWEEEPLDSDDEPIFYEEPV